MDDTMEVIGDIISKFFQKKFDEISYYTNIAEVMRSKENKIKEISIIFDIDDILIDEEVDEENHKVVTDYDEYTVDNNIEYTLYKNFTHKRAYGFKLAEQQMIRVKRWKYMLLETCEYLIKGDEKKFMGSENKESMNKSQEEKILLYYH